jgi:hypothetical protein
MPQGGLLHAPADLIDHRIGQPDGVEVVHHHPGVGERGDQRAGIAAPGVQRDRADVGQPVARSCMKPALHRGPGAVGYQVQQPAALQIHQASDVPGRCDPSGFQEAALVQPKLGDTLQARRIAHQRAAVVADRSHDGRPADPQVAGDRRHRVGVLTDPPARLGAGPLGQHRPRADRRRPLGPGPHAAGELTTAPDPLAPPEHHRPAADRQVTHPDRAAAVEFGPHPTAPDSRSPWPSSGRRAPTRRPPPPRPGPPSRPGRAAWRLTHYPVDPPGASCLADVRHPQAMRGPRSVLAAPTSPSGAHRPTLHDEEP